MLRKISETTIKISLPPGFKNGVIKFYFVGRGGLLLFKPVYSSNSLQVNSYSGFWSFSYYELKVPWSLPQWTKNWNAQNELNPYIDWWLQKKTNCFMTWFLRKLYGRCPLKYLQIKEKIRFLNCFHYSCHSDIAKPENLGTGISNWWN